MKGKLLLVLCLGLMCVSACGKGEEVAEERQENVVPLVSSSSEAGIESSYSSLAEDFITIYIEQEFDLELLKQKSAALDRYAGDSSLDIAKRDVKSLEQEVADYQRTKEVKNYASVTLVERKLHSVEVYMNGAKYLVDVTYKESSPAYAGVFDRRKLYTFKVQEGQIVQFEEVLLR